MMPPFNTYDQQHTNASRPSTDMNPTLRRHLSSSDAVSVDLGSYRRFGSSRQDKDKAHQQPLLSNATHRWPFPFSILQPHRKYRHRPSWLKWLLLLLGLLFLIGYVPFFSFVNQVPTVEEPKTPHRHAMPDHANSQHAYPDTTPVRDQIVLYRIIGNDLPPRHKEGQTLSNLQFILDHEPSFPNTRKIFLLNRISNPANEATIIRLLDLYQQEYVRLPFEEDIYKQLDFRLEQFPEADFLHSDDYRRYSKVSKLRILDFTYHDKNLYAMNNNGGRNTAIEHAKSLPNVKWIMPFDGNCFLSANAFKEITTQLDKHGDATKYFTVPMARLLDNSVLLTSSDIRPKAPEEPQIIFRHDADETYNLDMRYGRRSKLELLWTLGALQNRHLNRPTVPWEPVERPYSPDKGNFRTIGWVFRLFSGNPQQEENKKEASSIRAFNRLLAIQSYLDSLDESIARRDFHQEKMFLLNERAMANKRYDYWNTNKGVTGIVDELLRRADTIVQDLHTYYPSVVGNVASTSHQDDLPSSSTSDPTPPPPAIDHTPTPERLGALSQNVTILTVAHYFLGNEHYGKLAANLVRVHLLEQTAVTEEDAYSTAKRVPDESHLLDFLSDQGYSFPSLGRFSTVDTTPRHPLVRSPSSSSPSHLLSTSDLTKTDLSSLLDCIRLLRRMQMLTHKEYIYVQAIAADVLEYLITSPAGIHLAQMADHRGVLYDLQVTSLAAFTDDVRLFLRVANRCRMRIGKQFTEDGAQPFQEQRLHSMLAQPLIETTETDDDSASTPPWQASFHYQSLNLQYWTSLARGIQNIGIGNDIWHFTSENQASISHAVTRFLQHYALHDWQSDHDRAWAHSRLRPLMMMAHNCFQRATPLTTRDEQDRQWIDHAMAQEVFGHPFIYDQDLTAYQDNQGDLVQFLLDDQAKGRPIVPPFWMLSTVV
ncbi:hypothetical protein DM01DRAFT_1407542 [Hesseltinella vesiculosa]|uniref:Alginate lyase domain-containing protein n=1 Tax=Hesseltinella vesiculosa TaxID=101127 RepID=A0A1X2GHQ2_9FUNG|nr:hypothetical protein DM01DRAFT_1407542 [Hesseltinella vesiculosa]